MKNLFTLIFTIVAFSLAAQEVYFEESFENGLPESWSAEGEWTFGEPADLGSQFFGIPDIGSGNITVFNDDNLGNAHVGNGALTTPAIDLTAVEGPLFLEFYSYFPNLDAYGADETAIVSISTNGGKTFTEFANLEGASVFAGFFFDMSEYAGENIIIQFGYNDGANWNYGWAIDQVMVSSDPTLASRKDYFISAGTSTAIDEAQAGIEYTHEGFITNNGTETVTSFDIVMSNGTESMTTSVTGVEIPRFTVGKYKMDQSIIVEGNQTITVEIMNVNGEETVDNSPADNVASFALNAYTALNPQRGVLVEEGTGTWCPWCPRGTVNMDEMSKRFPDNFVGVAVHNDDPMVNTVYDNMQGSFPGVTGYPNAIVERTSVIDPGDILSSTLALMNQAPIATISIGAEMNGTSLTSSVRVDFLQDIEGDYNIAVIVTEDFVTGSNADEYYQRNNYAGGVVGPMGGYEVLPATVDASFMEFNHVGLDLIGGYPGVTAVEGAYSAGSTDGYVFDAYSIPSTVNMENVHLVAILMDNTGKVVNAASSSILDAASEGLYSNVATNDVYDATIASIYPNPVQDVANINMSLTESADVTVNVINSLGQTVSTRNFGQQSGNFQLQQDMTNLSEGMYMINITAGDRFITKKINKVN